MKVPSGITEIWVECESGTKYRSRLEGERLIIHVFRRSREINRDAKYGPHTINR